MTHTTQLKEKVQTLPTTPGIYLMKDQHGAVIYVGKAKNLKQRVRSYFQKNHTHSKKVLRMIFNIADFEIMQVDTELDALLLECQLIQKYHPLYNRQLNYSLRYSYVTVSETGILISEQPQAASCGPFRLYKKLPVICEILSEIYQLPWINPITRYTLEKQLPEISLLPLEQRLHAVRQFFSGSDHSYQHWMTKRIESFAASMQFESAQALLEQLQLLDYFVAHIRELDDFLQQKFYFALPLADGRKKYYQVAHGQIIHTQIVKSSQRFKPLSVAAANLPLTKTTIDPLLILLNYSKKTSEKQALR